MLPALTFCPFAGLLLLKTLAAAPSQPPAQTAHEPAQSPQFKLSMQVELTPKLGIETRSILPGETAHTGDRFRIKVWADQPVYLYVLDYAGQGWSELLYPQSDPQGVQTAEKVLLPSNGRPYVLDSETRDVTLYAYASTSPLDKAACTLLRLRCPLWPSEKGKTRGEGDDKKRDTRDPPPPPGRPPRDRDGQLISTQQERYIQIQSSEGGTALLRFSFKHVQ